MATEYYQIPSSQGLPAFEDADPWLAAATKSALSLDWTPKAESKQTPPSLFDSDDVTWKSVVPQQHLVALKSANSQEPTKKDANKQKIVEPIRPPKANQFISTSAQIDAWTVVASASAMAVTKSKQQKTAAIAVAPAKEETEEEKATIEVELAHQNRYKTELCKSFTETGICRYGTKCQFAHGKEELRPLMRHPKYKTEICKTFHITGTCPYGIRCRFIHTRSNDPIFAMASLSESSEIADDDSDDLFNESDKVAPPPGIPVPQWSKSWIPAAAAVHSKKSSRKHDTITVPEPSF